MLLRPSHSLIMKLQNPRMLDCRMLDCKVPFLRLLPYNAMTQFLMANLQSKGNLYRLDNDDDPKEDNDESVVLPTTSFLLLLTLVTMNHAAAIQRIILLILSALNWTPQKRLVCGHVIKSFPTLRSSASGVTRVGLQGQPRQLTAKQLRRLSAMLDFVLD